MDTRPRTTPAPTPSLTLARTGVLQRKCACGNKTLGGEPCEACGKKKLNLQRRAVDDRSEDPEVPPIVHDVLGSPGQPLDPAARAFMEARFGNDLTRVRTHTPTSHVVRAGLTVGSANDHHEQEAERVAQAVMRREVSSAPRSPHDFSNVRVHVGVRAAQAARAVSARAFTVGQNIVFGASEYGTGTAEGRRLLAHELTHTIQQGTAATPATLQRQDIADVPPAGRPGNLPDNLDNVAGEDDDLLITTDIRNRAEPGCPRVPTGLGNLAPDPPCPTGTEEVDGERFKFCPDSDVFISPAERTRLVSAVSSLDSRTTFEVHGYASKNAPGATQSARDAYNVNLSCHRAKRAARELVNAGVAEERIEIAAQGGSERFGSGANNEENRSVVVHHETPARQTLPSFNLPPNASAQQVQKLADAAKDRLVRGEYALAADAYVARWTCGHFRSLSEVIERATAIVDSSLAGDATEEGIISSTGLNTLRISPQIRLTDDPLECAANRIADLSFHHAVRPQMHGFDDQHSAALHLLFLAGIGKCHVSTTLFAHDFDVPLATDPQAGQQPLCADAPLPGAIDPQQQRTNQPGAPSFTLVDLNVPPGSGSVNIDIPDPRGFLIEANPDGGLAVASTVTVAGDLREIQKYEIGVMQTVLSEDFEVSYFGGQKIRGRMPLPLRDGPKQGDSRSAPPWFDVESRARAQPGNVSVGMTDLPNMFLFRAFTDLDRAKFFSRRSVPPLPGQTRANANDRPDFNPFDQTTRDPKDPTKLRPTPPDLRNAPDRGHREMHFNTWVVARQANPPAPLSRFSSIFLGGKRITFRIDANFTGDALRPRGTGSWLVSQTDASGRDQHSMRFLGATPADFAGSPPVAGRAGVPPLFNEFLISQGAPPIDQAGGINNLTTLRQAVEQVVTPHRRALALTQGLTVQITWDMTTGRVILDDSRLSRGAVRVISGDTGPQVPPDQAARLAGDIFPEIRKIVIGQIGQGQAPLSLRFAQSPL